MRSARNISKPGASARRGALRVPVLSPVHLPRYIWREREAEGTHTSVTPQLFRGGRAPVARIRPIVLCIRPALNFHSEVSKRSVTALS